MNTQHPLVSVVILSYNHQDYVIKAIESIQNQTYTNCEIIILDDASTDHSAKLIQKYCKESSGKITTIFQKENKGIKHSIQLAISQCNGKYVAFCESDDFLDTSSIEKKVDILEKKGDVHLVFSDIKPECNTKLTPQMSDYLKGVHFFGKYYFSHGNTFSYSVFKFNPVACFSNIVVRKQAIKGYKILKAFEFWSDLQLLIHLSKLGKFYYVNEKLTNWRLHENSTNHTMKKLDNFYSIAKQFNYTYRAKPLLSLRAIVNVYILKCIFTFMAFGVIKRRIKRNFFY